MNDFVKVFSHFYDHARIEFAAAAVVNHAIDQDFMTRQIGFSLTATGDDISQFQNCPRVTYSVVMAMGVLMGCIKKLLKNVTKILYAYS